MQILYGPKKQLFARSAI